MKWTKATVFELTEGRSTVMLEGVNDNGVETSQSINGALNDLASRLEKVEEHPALSVPPLETPYKMKINEGPSLCDKPCSCDKGEIERDTARRVLGKLRDDLEIDAIRGSSNIASKTVTMDQVRYYVDKAVAEADELAAVKEAPLQKLDELYEEHKDKFETEAPDGKS